MILGPVQVPENISLSGVNSTHLNFTWNPVISHCDSIYYVLNTTNCGSCPVTSMISEMTCKGIVLDGRTCHVLVKAIVCNIHGSFSQRFSLALKGNSCTWNCIHSL